MTITPNACVADGGLINPEAFPARAADLDTSKITGAATDLRTMGSTVEKEVDHIKTSWGGLTAHYEAPEAQQVYALMDPAATSAGELRSALDSTADHLDTYASTLAGIKPRLQALEDRAAAFRAEVINGVQVDASEAADATVGQQLKGWVDWVPLVDEEQVTVPWYDDDASIERNKTLLDELHALLEEISTAASTCANSIHPLVEGVCMAPAEAVPSEAFTSAPQAMPWGSPREEERNCTESTWHGAYQFGYGMYSGGAMLIGYNTEDGTRGWDNAGQAWGGLGDFLGSTLVLFTLTPHLAAAGVPMPGSEWLIERGDTAVSGWSSLVGYDFAAAQQGGDGWHRWREDGVSTGVESALNVGTFFIPVAGGAGAGARLGATGARVTRIAGGVADVAVPGGGWLVRGGVRVSPGLRTALRFGDDLPAGLGRGGPGSGRSPGSGLLEQVGDGPVEAMSPSRPVSESLFDRPTQTADRPQGGALNRYDPEAAPRHTVDQSEAPARYGPDDVREAYDQAPVDRSGRPVDHRTGEPLRPDGPDGERRWYMRWDPDSGQWVAENPGTGHTSSGDLPPTGEPGSFGYDADGHRMPYANHRPDYADGQVEQVWNNSREEQIRLIEQGSIDRPIPDENQLWVRTADDEWRLVEWEPGQSRDGLWDMGHIPEARYAELHQSYLNHEMSLDEFLAEYREPANYRVEDPARNRAHLDE